jgi:hypothetical protein
MTLLKRILRLLSRPAQLRKQWGLLWGYLLFRVRYGFIGSPVDTAPTGKKILIVNFTDSPYHAMTEGIMARAMRTQGVTPVVVTYRANEWMQRYFRACGVTEFVFFEERMRAFRDPKDEEEIRSFLTTKPTNEGLLGYEFDGVNIGANALSVVLRNARAGSVDLSVPHITESALKMLMDARAAVRAARQVLAEQSPHTLLFTETGYTPHGELFAVAVEKGMHPIQYVHSQRLDAITAKRYVTLKDMVDPISISKKSWETLKKMPWTAQQEEAFMRELDGHYRDKTWFNFIASRDKKNKTPEEVRAQLGLDAARKTAVIYSHVVWDASFYYGKNIFRDYDDWLVQTVKEACANPHLQWVIKLHPDYIWQTKFMEKDSEMRDMIAVLANVGGELPSHVKVVPPDTDISTYSFFAVADYCITVRGTIGLECPAFGVTTFTAGTGRYAYLGFTEDSTDVPGYLEKMRTIHESPPMSVEKRTLARKHAYGLFALRPIPMRSFTLIPLYENDNVMDHRLAIHARSAKEMDTDPGLRSFADWILHSTDEDYLASPV